jgi:hypothetical protein
VPKGDFKAYALINDVLQEYDVCLSSLDSVHRIDDTIYEYLGRGVIHSVCNIPNYSKQLMFFYKKKKVEKKKDRW